MKYLCFVSLLIASPLLQAQSSENPFMKPEQRQPVVAPVIEYVQPQLTLDQQGSNDPQNGLNPAVESAPVDAKLIAVINGEEVWLTNEDKTYIRQKERDGSRLRLQEADPVDLGLDGAVPDLPVVPAGRPSPTSPKR